MPYDGFIFTEDAPEEIKKKRDMKGNILFGSSRWEREVEPKPRVVYVPYQPKQKSMGYSKQPEYGYQRPLPRSEKKVDVVKEIGSTIKAINKFSEQRRQAKLNEAKNLRKDIEQRLAVLKAKEEINRLKKAQRELKTAGQREAIYKAKQGVSSAVNFVKGKIRPGVYGGVRKVNLPSVEVKQ